VTRIGVIERDYLKAIRPMLKKVTLIFKHPRSPSLKCSHHLVSPGPVIVVSKHGEHWGIDLLDKGLELREVARGMGDVVSSQANEIGIFRVAELDGCLEDDARCHAPDMEVGEVSDA